MDFIFGFICGYIAKEIVAYLNKLSKWDYDNREYYDINPLSKDDLP